MLTPGHAGEPIPWLSTHEISGSKGRDVMELVIGSSAIKLDRMPPLAHYCYKSDCVSVAYCKNNRNIVKLKRSFITGAIIFPQVF